METIKTRFETLAKSEFTPAIWLLFGLRIIHSVGGEYNYSPKWRWLVVDINTLATSTSVNSCFSIY